MSYFKSFTRFYCVIRPHDKIIVWRIRRDASETTNRRCLNHCPAKVFFKLFSLPPRVRKIPKRLSVRGDWPPWFIRINLRKLTTVQAGNRARSSLDPLCYHHVNKCWRPIASACKTLRWYLFASEARIDVFVIIVSIILARRARSSHVVNNNNMIVSRNTVA